MNAFKQTKITGDKGEQRIIDYFSSHDDVASVERITHIGEQFKGKDIRVKFKDGLLMNVEIKTELSDKYGNFFLETWSNKSTGRQGWIHTCQSDLFVYQFLDQDWFYVMATKDLKDWFKSDSVKLNEKPQSKWNQKNDTWGCPANIQMVVENTKANVIHFKV